MADLTPVQRSILVDLLVYGDNGPGNIARRCGYNRDAVSRRFAGLVDEGLIRPKGHGVYEIRDAGREVARNLLRSGYNPWIPVSEEDSESD